MSKGDDMRTKSYDYIPSGVREKIDRIKRLIGHNYSDYEIFVEMADDHPGHVQEWIKIAHRELDGVSLI